MNCVSRKFMGGLAIAAGLLLAMLVLPVSLNAQAFYGSIVGTVTDTAGAIVTGGTVTVTNIGTNEKRTAQTNAAGDFSFVNLVPADYKIEVNQTNFKHYVRQPVPVQVGGTIRIDVALQVGAVSETVQVTTEAPLLQTDSGSQSADVEGQTVQEMPLNGRNPLNLIALTPGAVAQGGSSGSAGLNAGGHTSPGGWGNYAISGGIAGQSATYLDGAPNNVLGENDVAFVPTQDAIQEFSILSGAVPADFGRFGGGVVNMTTKSGSNAWHGSAYEYIRNRDFNANDWLDKQGELQQGEANEPGEWTQNQFGASASGPILRDKAFFLFSWEALRLRIGSSTTALVPTQAEQNGIFASAISDPLGLCNISTTANPGSWTITNLGSGGCGSTAGSVMKQYYDLPNVSAGNHNYFASVPGGDNQKQYNGRIDYNLSTNQRVFGRYTYWTMDELAFNPFPDNTKFNGSQPAHEFATHQVVLGDTYTLNPTNILDVRVSWLRQALNAPMPTITDYSQFGGDWAALAKQMSIHLLPFPELASEGGGGAGFHPYGPQGHFQTNWGINANWIRIMGKHSLKAGFEGRLENQEQVGTENSGSFAFNGNFTGVDFADLLMGYPANSGSGPGGSNPGFFVGSFATGYNYYQAYYLQDNWTVNRNLTLNLGIRYELPGSVAESHDKQTVLLYNTVDPSTKVTGTLGLVNSSLYSSRNVRDLMYNGLAPRFGFAYRLGDNMSVRGGYGLTWLPIDIANGLMPYNSVINGAQSSFNNGTNTLSATNLCSADGFAATTCFHTSDNPFAPAGTAGAAGSNQLALPVGRSEGQTFMSQYVGQRITGSVPTDPYAYNQLWNLSFSRQFKGDLMIELGYAGAKGTHLTVPPVANGTNGLDELPTADWSQGAALLGKTTTATVDPGGYSVAAGGMTVGQSLRPRPFYADMGDSLPSWGATTYHAGHIMLEKRFKAGGLVMANYTWSKEIGDTDTSNGNVEIQPGRGAGAGIVQDWNNPRGERSILSYNVPQRAVVAYVLPLPFGQGQKFGANVNQLASRVISGWTLNGITSFQSGYPLSLIDGRGNDLTNSFGAGQLRPNYTPGCNKSVSGSLHALAAAGKPTFNTACFVALSSLSDPAANFELGNEPRVDGGLHAEGVDNWDISLAKTTKIVEKANLEFRAEFFNVANHAQFGPQQNDASASQNFGTIGILANNPRLMQLSLRLNY
jgi:hypothetical protein